MGLFGKKKDDYKILTDRSRRRLQKKIEKYLKKGYQLEGGISQSGGFLMTAKIYTQAVSKRNDK
jgi:hypothetical protein